MKLELDQIITVEDLKDPDALSERLEETDALYLLLRNNRGYVLTTPERYQVLTAAGETRSAEGGSGPELEQLLNKIGKKVFVTYYRVFQADQHPEEVLRREEGFTPASCRSRSSAARSLFRSGRELEALQVIAASSRVDGETARQALALLTGHGAAVPPTLRETEDGPEVKLGRMMRQLLTLLLEQDLLSDRQLAELTDPDRSRTLLRLNYPVLKQVGPGEDPDVLKRDRNGYNRYYGTAVEAGGQRWLICSQWVDSLHGEAADRWAVETLTALLERRVAALPSGAEFLVRDLLSDFWPCLTRSVKAHIGRIYGHRERDRGVVLCLEKEDGVQRYRKL